MGDRNSCTGGHCNSARYTRNNFEWNSGFKKRSRLFATATKYKRIAALQSADRFPISRFLNHQRLDVLLLKVFITGFFTGIDDLGAVPCFFKKMEINKPIVQDNVRFAQTRQAANRDVVRIVRSRAYDVDSPNALHDGHNISKGRHSTLRPKSGNTFDTLLRR